MFISIDYTSSSLLNHIVHNSGKYLTQELLPAFLPEDAKTLLMKLRLIEGEKQALKLLLDYLVGKPETVVKAMNIEGFFEVKTLDASELADLVRVKGQRLSQPIRTML